jgi:hypothetical protein
MTVSLQWHLAARRGGEIRSGEFELVYVPVPEPGVSVSFIWP